MTVSKTTTQEKAEAFRKAKLEATGDGRFGIYEVVDFADSISAELQKENARLREALQWALARIPAPVKRTRENGEYCDAYEKAAALSKEKAK